MLHCVSQHLPNLMEKYCAEITLRNNTPTPNEFVTFFTKHFQQRAMSQYPGTS